MAWQTADTALRDVDEARERRHEAERRRRLQAIRDLARGDRRQQVRRVQDHPATTGRPRVEPTEAQQQSYIDALAAGIPQREAAAQVGLSHSSILRYMRRDESFARQVSGALVVRFESAPSHDGTVIARHRRFYGHCSCGWRSASRSSRRLALDAIAAHVKAVSA